MNAVIENVNREFFERFKSEPSLYYSPGRINFIGEHIDYNDGFVMPAAINKGMYYAIGQNNSDRFNFFSIDFKEDLSIKKEDIKKKTGWKNYVLSVLNEFIILDKTPLPFDCVFGGNIANGAGMSSSAAVEGGLAFAINEMNGFGMSRKDLALLCQRAEHNFPGVMCGIMDQYANMCGKKDNVILLDCKTVENKYFPLKLQDYEVVLINSNVHHSLASSAYNERRKECEEGLAILKSELNINSFRDVKSLTQLEEVKSKMPEVVYKRCTYVVGEILRTLHAADLLQFNDLIGFGKLMFETHTGLKDLYEVSCKELDYLVSLASENKNVIGSRLMGGGFGGCTINIVKKEGVSEFLSQSIESYQKKFQINAEHYQVELVDGTHQL
ncbi:MAG: galactokinase [Ginsengibacter sp.]